jgi:ABC-type Fe3+/spermidine/putrescine transport system ATPase subunit
VWNLPTVGVRNLEKHFGDVLAVDDVSFEVEDSKLVTLLGPSGCGKTTTLRCIAGLEKPEQGEVLIGEKVVSSSKDGVFVSPEKRGLSMVFQSYAVWPHMSVYDNISYGLKIKKIPKVEIDRKVKQVLSLVGLSGLEDRYATKLSGGQQQRVALARSIVLEPAVLLFDEPLSNLDARLRESMRFELKDLMSKLAITSVYVTHDQSEAMVLSDRIILMEKGKIVQEGTPLELYRKPKNQFVASFLGSTSPNFLEGKLLEIHSDRSGLVELENGAQIECYLSGISEGERVIVALRPEDLKILSDMPRSRVNYLKGRIGSLAYLGDHTEYKVRVQNNVILVKSDSFDFFDVNEEVYVVTEPHRINVFRA